MTNASLSAPPTHHTRGATLGGLRRFNTVLGVLHLSQGIAMLAVASAFSLPITGAFLRIDPATDKLVAVPDELVRVRIGPLVAGFLFLSAIAHLALASPARSRGSLSPSTSPAPQTLPPSSMRSSRRSSSSSTCSPSTCCCSTEGSVHGATTSSASGSTCS